MTHLSLEDAPPPHDFAIAVVWQEAKEPDDHPAMGTMAVLVRPDGSSDVLGGGGAGGWGVVMQHSVGIQTLEFTQPGRYFVEIRPSLAEPGIPISAGDRRLAILPLDVS